MERRPLTQASRRAGPDRDRVEHLGSRGRELLEQLARLDVELGAVMLEQLTGG